MGTTSSTFSSSTYATGVAITSDAGADGTAGYYKTNDQIRCSITFTEALTVIGSPQMRIDVGGQTRMASFAGGSGTSTLDFVYTVGSDLDANGVSVVANALLLNGAIIRNLQGQTVDLSTPAMADAIDHRVNSATVGALTMDAMGGDYFIAASELGSVGIQGTAAAGCTLKLAFDSGFSRQLLVPDNGNWSYLFTAADLALIGQGTEQVTATLTDLAGNTSDQQAQRVLTVQTLSSAGSPRILGPSGTSGDNNSADSVVENTAAVHVFTADKAVTWSLGGGVDASRFKMDSVTGALSFVNAPDFEAPLDAGADNRYTVVVRATDGSNLMSEQTVAVEVTNTHDTAPVITSGATVGFAENGNGVAYIATATDLDNLGALTYALAGADANHFNINASTGVVTFKNLPDFEAPVDAGGNNVYDIAVAASNGLHTSTKAVTLDVTDIDETLGGLATPSLQVVALDNQMSVDVRTNIVLNFDHNLTAVAGKYIRIIDDGGAGFQGENTTNNFALEVTGPQVTIIGNRVTINPSHDLDFGSNYHVEIDAGAFISDGLAFAGVSDITTINFSTVAPMAGGSSGAASIISDGTGAMAASLRWWDIENLGSVIGAERVLNAAGGDNAYVIADYVVAPDNAWNGYDGVGVGNFNVAVNNFSNGDLLYVDNRGVNNSSNDTAGSAILDYGNETYMVWEGRPGDLGGQVVIAGMGFESVEGWRSAIGSTYAPYVIA